MITDATFTQHGTYLLRLSSTDGQYTAIDEVTITVNPTATLSSIKVTPATGTVQMGGTLQFSAQGEDQSGAPIPIAPTWSVSGGGSIDQTGLFSAGSAAGGPYTVTATQGGVVGTAQITVSGQLVISNLSVASGKPYVVNTSGLTKGDLVYIDRAYVYTSVLAAVQGAAFIQTANNDKNASNTSFLSFSVNQDVTVYVGYDVRGTPATGGSLPNWLRGWTDTGLSLGTSDVTRRVYSQNFSVGSVTLGGNMAAGAKGAKSNYTVIIVP